MDSYEISSKTCGLVLLTTNIQRTNKIYTMTFVLQGKKIQTTFGSVGLLGCGNPTHRISSNHGTENLSLRSFSAFCNRFFGWWFGTFLFFHILGIIIPTDYYFQRGSNHQPILDGANPATGSRPTGANRSLGHRSRRWDSGWSRCMTASGGT